MIPLVWWCYWDLGESSIVSLESFLPPLVNNLKVYVLFIVWLSGWLDVCSLLWVSFIFVESWLVLSMINPSLVFVSQTPAVLHLSNMDCVFIAAFAALASKTVS